MVSQRHAIAARFSIENGISYGVRSLLVLAVYPML